MHHDKALFLKLNGWNTLQMCNNVQYSWLKTLEFIINNPFSHFDTELTRLAALTYTVPTL